MELSEQDITDIFDNFSKVDIYHKTSTKLNKLLTNIHKKYFNDIEKYESFSDNKHFEKLISKLKYSNLLDLEEYKLLYKYYENYMKNVYLYMHNLEDFNDRNLIKINAEITNRLYLVQKYYNYDVDSKKCVDAVYIIFFYLNFLKILQYLLVDIKYYMAENKYANTIKLESEYICAFIASNKVFIENIIHNKLYYNKECSYKNIKLLYSSSVEKSKLCGFGGKHFYGPGNNSLSSIKTSYSDFEINEGLSFYNKMGFEPLHDKIIDIIIGYKVDLECTEKNDILYINFFFKQNFIDYGPNIINYIDDTIIFKYLNEKVNADKNKFCITDNKFLMKYGDSFDNWDEITRLNLHHKKLLCSNHKKITPHIFLEKYLRKNNIKSYIHFLNKTLLIEMINGDNKLLNYKPIKNAIQKLCLENLDNNIILLYSVANNLISWDFVINILDLNERIKVIKIIMDFRKLTYNELIYVKNIIGVQEYIFYTFLNFNINLFLEIKFEIEGLNGMQNNPRRNPFNRHFYPEMITKDILLLYLRYKNKFFYDTIKFDVEYLNFEKDLKTFIHGENNNLYIHNVFEVLKTCNFQTTDLFINCLDPQRNYNNPVGHEEFRKYDLTLHAKNYELHLKYELMQEHISFNFMNLLDTGEFKNHIVEKFPMSEYKRLFKTLNKIKEMWKKSVFKYNFYC